MSKNSSDRKILITDDESEMRIALETTLQREGYATACAENGQAALDLLDKNEYDLLLSDVRMPKINGIDLLRAVKERHPRVAVIMMTAYGTIDSAVECMKEGAFDYLLKPFSADVVVSAIKRAFLNAGDNTYFPVAAAEKKGGDDARRIVTRNKEMQKLLQFVENVAYSKSTVLIIGESGTGKEMFARHVHQLSPRAGKPFVAVNCAALPEGLLESEMFGHEKGAFTGAASAKEGKFELAHQGTLLLDEITEMNLPLQAKLLRVLQEHEVDRVGGRRPIPVDVRVIATTNRDLKTYIKDGKFREDLYYRLNVIPLKLPALRERPEDIPLLAEHFLEKHGRESGKSIAKIAAETIDFLKKYRWPGNVRELENTIERAVLLCRGNALQISDLLMEDDATPPSGAADAPAPPAGGTLSEMEKQLILKTLRETDNNKTKCAELLGISIRTLRNKLAEYNAGNDD